MALLSLRAYAKHRGVSLAAVQKAIKSGRIATTADGSIDSERADADWSAKTRPGQKRRSPAPATVAPVVPYVEPPRSDPGGAGGLDYFRARAIRESYLARLAKIEFEEKSAKLVSRDEVQIAAFTKARTVRDSLLNIPDRLAATLAAEADADNVHQMLTVEIRKALDELAGADRD
ncbi:MAG: hypothetical protein IH602_23890 [Bryobacteraceae bacterium]|nr:hypothetical protein [Bryobacteraceae bacterium]